MYLKCVSRFSKYFRYMLFLFTVTVISLLWTTPASAARDLTAPKVIVFVVDDLDLQDLSNKKLINFQKAIRTGAIGLMNTRSGGLVAGNRSSAYLSLSLGTRVVFPDYLPRVINGEPTTETGLFNVVMSPNEINDWLDSDSRKKPQIFGDIVRNNGKTIGLIGDAEDNSQFGYASLLAFNSSGRLGIGNVGPGFTVLKSLSEKVIQMTDIIFVDFGEMARIADSREKLNQSVTPSASRQKVLERADFLLGNLIEISDSENAVLMIISPMSKKDRQVSAFKNLSPLIMYGKGVQHGILTSNTTRRAGLISNIDISPTILKITGINPKSYGYVGETIQVINVADNMNTIQGSLDRFVQLKASRYIIHGLYILILLLFSLVTIDCVRKGNFSHPRILRTLGLIVITIPAVNLIVPLGVLIPLDNQVDSIYPGIVLIITTIVVAGFIGSKSLNRTLNGMAAASTVTALFMIADLITGRGNLLNTPLGFNDIFSGGRYYGLNNDSMGILLGSSVFSSFYISEKLGFDRIKTLFMVEILIMAAALSLMPGFGANVGGTIAALTTGLVAGILLISRKGLNSARFIGSIIVVIALELIISYTDTLSGSQTHAGKAINALMSGNIAATMVEIIKSKLLVFSAMLVIPPWNILLFAQFLGCLYLYKKHFNTLLAIKAEYPVLSISFMVIFYGGIAAFIFNDTGVIATALMLTYLTMPLGILVADNYNLGEYHSDLSQKI